VYFISVVFLKFTLTKSSLSPNFLRKIQAKTYTPFQTVVTKSMPHARHKIKNSLLLEQFQNKKIQ
jgi:hypothetical protein